MSNPKMGERIGTKHRMQRKKKGWEANGLQVRGRMSVEQKKEIQAQVQIF